MKKSIIFIILGIITILSFVGCEADQVDKITVSSFQEVGGQLTSKQLILTLEVSIPTSATQAEADSARMAYLVGWENNHPEYILKGHGFLSGVWRHEEREVKQYTYHIESVN